MATVLTLLLRYTTLPIDNTPVSGHAEIFVTMATSSCQPAHIPVDRRSPRIGPSHLYQPGPPKLSHPGCSIQEMLQPSTNKPRFHDLGVVSARRIRVGPAARCRDAALAIRGPLVRRLRTGHGGGDALRGDYLSETPVHLGRWIGPSFSHLNANISALGSLGTAQEPPRKLGCSVSGVHIW